MVDPGGICQRILKASPKSASIIWIMVKQTVHEVLKELVDPKLDSGYYGHRKVPDGIVKLAHPLKQNIWTTEQSLGNPKF